MSSQASLKAKAKTETIDTGISRRDTGKLVKHLSQALADTYVLYLQTQGAHWNVVGPSFYSLHKLTEEHYEDQAQAIDAIAERIRALGHVTPASFGEIAELSVLESPRANKSAAALIEQLVDSNQRIAERLRKSVSAADDAEDVYTADLLTARIGAHEEAAWMLRSLLAT